MSAERVIRHSSNTTETSGATWTKFGSQNGGHQACAVCDVPDTKLKNLLSNAFYVNFSYFPKSFLMHQNW